MKYRKNSKTNKAPFPFRLNPLSNFKLYEPLERWRASSWCSFSRRPRRLTAVFSVNGGNISDYFSSLFDHRSGAAHSSGVRRNPFNRIIKSGIRSGWVWGSLSWYSLICSSQWSSSINEPNIVSWRDEIVVQVSKARSPSYLTTVSLKSINILLKFTSDIRLSSEMLCQPWKQINVSIQSR